MITVVFKFIMTRGCSTLEKYQNDYCAPAFKSGWVTQLRIISLVITDRGAQFESLDCDAGMRICDSTIRTSSYNPKANSKVEWLVAYCQIGWQMPDFHTH